MPNPPFQPLTLSVEQLQRMLSDAVKRGDQREHERDAARQEAASLRQRLEAREAVCDEWARRHDAVQAQLEQAQKERDAAREVLSAFSSAARQTEDRASQAEAALKELKNLIYRFKRGTCWCEVAIGNPNYHGIHSDTCLQLQEWERKQT